METTTTTAPEPVSATQFNDAHQDVLVALALMVFLLAALLVGSWGRT